MSRQGSKDESVVRFKIFGDHLQRIEQSVRQQENRITDELQNGLGKLVQQVAFRDQKFEIQFGEQILNGRIQFDDAH